MKRTLPPTQIRLHPRGFSLIEIMVVIAIIILLAGLLLAGGRRLKQANERSHTKIILSVCKSAALEYSERYDIVSQFYQNLNEKTTKTQNAPVIVGNGKGIIDDTIEEFVYKALKYETSSKILKTLGKNILIDKDEDGFLEVRDGFGNKIKFFLTTDTNSDSLKTITGKAYFSSAGIDGKWETDDDLYSYEAE